MINEIENILKRHSLLSNRTKKFDELFRLKDIQKINMFFKSEESLKNSIFTDIYFSYIKDLEYIWSLDESYSSLEKKYNIKNSKLIASINELIENGKILNGRIFNNQFTIKTDFKYKTRDKNILEANIENVIDIYFIMAFSNFYDYEDKELTKKTIKKIEDLLKVDEKKDFSYLKKKESETYELTSLLSSFKEMTSNKNFNKLIKPLFSYYIRNTNIVDGISYLYKNNSLLKNTINDFLIFLKMRDFKHLVKEINKTDPFLAFNIRSHNINLRRMLSMKILKKKKEGYLF